MLREGLSLLALEKKLNEESVKSLKCRKQVKKVILLDWHSKELTKKGSNSLSILFNAIWKVRINLLYYSCHGLIFVQF